MAKRTSRTVKRVTGTISPEKFDDFLADNFVPKVKAAPGSGPASPHGCARFCARTLKVGRKVLRCKESHTTVSKGGQVSITCIYE